MEKKVKVRVKIMRDFIIMYRIIEAARGIQNATWGWSLEKTGAIFWEAKEDLRKALDEFDKEVRKEKTL